MIVRLSKCQIRMSFDQGHCRSKQNNLHLDAFVYCRSKQYNLVNVNIHIGLLDVRLWSNKRMMMEICGVLTWLVVEVLSVSFWSKDEAVLYTPDDVANYFLSKRH